ncbi:chemotaxis protein CheW [Phaeobacter sp. B1627]|uniref:chemotaxis protein CheW n=1 Tax=Phaeobacter sp. B1627 TaxID=2583809 RepID=UPI001117E2F5|nr:chemotaxis protein CheW [Phaeobacter sp. B1627]TNJ43350.1 hypothetical protein FGE21_09725 [Phaeobacter sp. B1627]
MPSCPTTPKRPDPVRDVVEGTGGDDIPEPADMMVGVVEIGGMLFAIPIEHVREVIPAPIRFQRLPTQHPDLVGGVLLRGKAIPVQALHRRLGLDAPVFNTQELDLSDPEVAPGTGAAKGVIVVVRANGRVTGVLVDVVRCLLQLGDTWAQNLPEEPDELVCGGYICDRHGHFSLLSVPELLSIPLAPSDEISATTRRRSRVRKLAHIKFQVGELNFLIAIKDIASTVPTSVLEPWPVSSGGCLGLISRHGMEMPMLDTLANFGFPGCGARPTEASGIVIEYPDDHALSFNVDRVVSVVNIEEDAVYKFPPSVTRRWNLFDGVHIDEGGDQCFVINVEACRKDADLLRLASTSHRKKPEPKKRMATSSGRQEAAAKTSDHGSGASALAGIRSQSNRYLTVCAAGDFAVPIEAVSEIMRVPVAFGAADFEGHLVNLSYRNRLMPVYDCAQRRGNGMGNFGTEAGILILKKDGHHYGLAVEAMKSIDTGRLKGFRNSDGSASEVPSEQLVELGLGPSRRLVPVEDPTLLLP